MCELLVGLPDVEVVGVGEWLSWLRIAVRTRYNGAGRNHYRDGGEIRLP